MKTRLNRRMSASLLALCVAGGLLLVAGDAQAQKSAAAGKDKSAVTTKADKGMAAKKGVKDSLGTKEIDANKLPGKFEMTLAFGSVAAMIACIKYL